MSDLVSCSALPRLKACITADSPFFKALPNLIQDFNLFFKPDEKAKKGTSEIVEQYKGQHTLYAGATSVVAHGYDPGHQLMSEDPYDTVASQVVTTGEQQRTGSLILRSHEIIRSNVP